MTDYPAPTCASRAADARRSASSFSGDNNSHLMVTIPGEKNDQYRRNRMRPGDTHIGAIGRRSGANAEG